MYSSTIRTIHLIRVGLLVLTLSSCQIKGNCIEFGSGQCPDTGIPDGASTQCSEYNGYCFHAIGSEPAGYIFQGGYASFACESSPISREFRIYTGGDFQQTNSTSFTFTVTGSTGGAATTTEVWADWNDAIAGWLPGSGGPNIAVGSVEDLTSNTPTMFRENGVNEIFARSGGLPESHGAGLTAVSVCYPSSDPNFSCLNVECDMAVFGLMATEIGYVSTELTTNAIAQGEQMSLSLIFEHEFGHILGIDHPLTGVDSVMATEQTRPQSFRTATSTDLQAAIAIYGP